MRAVAKFPELCLRIWFGRTSKKCSGSWNWPYTMASCSHVAICCHALPCYATVCFAPSTAGLGIERFLKCASHCLPKLWMLGAFAYSSVRQCREDRNPRCATGGWLCTCSQAPRNASRVVRQGELLLSFCFGRGRFQINYAELCPGQNSAAMLQWVNHQYIRIFLSRWGQFNCIAFNHGFFVSACQPRRDIRTQLAEASTPWIQARYKHMPFLPKLLQEPCETPNAEHTVVQGAAYQAKMCCSCMKGHGPMLYWIIWQLLVWRTSQTLRCLETCMKWYLTKTYQYIPLESHVLKKVILCLQNYQI